MKNAPRRAGAIVPRNCRNCGLKFSRLSLLVSFSLAVLKAVIGTLAGSQALVANALYSVNDMLSSIVVVISLRVARRPADDKHAYGYGNAEFIAMGLVSLFLAGGVLLVLFLSITGVAHGGSGPPHFSALVFALVVMGINLLLAQKGFCAARKLSSPALQTCAQHSHVDAISSLAVAIGIGAALLGLHVVDSIVAIFETLHVMWLAGTLLSKASRGVMDTSLPAATSARLRRACRDVPGVLDVLEFRTRRVGPQSWVDIVLIVRGNLDVRQADRIANDVRQTVRGLLSESADVQVRFRAKAPRKSLPVFAEGMR